jgi:SNF2 family DNA or RNA helicase
VLVLLAPQWTSFLTLLESILKEKGWEYVRYDGTLNTKERDDVVKTFRENCRVNVMLCSLKAASYGLNLTCATNVILVDPWWNPSVSDQAIDRCHRIGQKRDVKVTQLTIENTVEAR